MFSRWGCAQLCCKWENFRKKIFDRIWIQPAAGDAGGSLGAALALWHKELKKERMEVKDEMQGSYLGPKYSQKEIEQELTKLNAKFEVLDNDKIIDETSESLKNGDAVGWFQGRMEFGPRALGGRSILGDPRSPNMQKNLNLKVKYRESFRPFAPSILAEEVDKWFKIKESSPYMLLVAEVIDSKKINMSDDEKNFLE